MRNRPPNRSRPGAGGPSACCACRCSSSWSTARSSTWLCPPWSAAARHHQPAAVGRRRLHPGHGRAAAHAWAAWATGSGATARWPAASSSSASGRSWRPVRLRRRAHRLPGRHGCRRRGDHARHLVDPDQRVHRARRAGQGHRHVVGGRRPRRRHRPDTRRLAARALRLGLDLHGQPAHRRRRPGRRPPRGAALGEPPSRRSTRSAPCCRSPGWSLSSTPSSRPRLRLAERPHPRPRRRRRRAYSPAWVSSSSAAPTPWSTCGSSAMPASARPASPSP